jgi:hypothetical protein
LGEKTKDDGPERPKTRGEYIIDMDTLHTVQHVFIPGGGRAATASAVKLGTVVSGGEELLPLNALLAR